MVFVFSFAIMSDKSELKAELERKKRRLAQIREEKRIKEEERKKEVPKRTNIMETRKSFCTSLLLRLLLILMITFNAKIVRLFNCEWMPTDSCTDNCFDPNQCPLYCPTSCTLCSDAIT